MKIKDFNEKVRIGSTVYIGDRRVTVEDIDRREHTAKIRHSGWVRCSEFELQPNGIADPILSEKRSYKNQYVVATMPGGERLKFPSLQEAGMSLGLSRSYIKRLCTEKGQTKRGIRFEYVYLEDAAELGTS